MIIEPQPTERKCYLYRVSLKEDPSKDYVGISYNYKRRWSEHRSAARNITTSKSRCHAITRALHKYGASNFEFKLLGIYRNRAIAAEMEKICIGQFNWGYYNLTGGGEGTAELSEDTRQKKSDKLKAVMNSPGFQEKRVATVRQFYSENPDAIKNLSEKMTDIRKNPEIEARRAEAYRTTVSTEESKLKHGRAAVKRIQDHPESYARSAQFLRDRNNDPTVREQISDFMKVHQNQPSVKKRISQQSKQQWAEAKSLGFSTLRQLAEYKKTLNNP